MTTILLATQNEKKHQELKALLKKFKGAKVICLRDLERVPPIIVEDGKSFRQNAIKKAVIMSGFFDGLVIADDSGLEVNALGGKPGVRSKRFARSMATDIENNKKLLKLLENVSEKNRGARFVCHVALASRGKLLEDFEGTVKGHIAFEPKGPYGFGYDPLFVPKGYDKTFAEMAGPAKNRISHRALALRKLKRSIRKYL